jgi:prenyl protein peptidase
MQTIRNLVVGPVTEELVFRACMCPVLLAGGFSPTTTIIIVPFFFGIAHLHHIMQHIQTGYSIGAAIFTVVFQIGYTTIFGMYSAFIFVRTGHILPAILAHSFCNYMGFPHFGEVPGHPSRNILAAVYVLGLVSFFYFLPSFHDPHYYSSVLYSYATYVPQ